MDSNTRGPEGMGHDGEGHAPGRRPPRESRSADFGQHAPALARTVQLVAGDFLLTVNPVDGSEIEACPPGERPGRPQKYTAAERAETDRGARPPVPPGASSSTEPLLERQDEREQLVRLLARGRSVRLTGPGGSGRTSLLDLVADDCSDLAPDGVVRLTGYHRTTSDLLHDLFHAVHSAPLHRPDHDELLEYVRDIGAVVVVDDIEFGGSALDELLDATPECAFLIGATPDVPAPSEGSAVEEVLLSGLDRAGGVELIERGVNRVLTEEEANWAGDLWFESEGLPLRFVQAGALLRQRDQLRASAKAVDEFGVFEDAPPVDAVDADTDDGDATPLPSLGEAAAPAPLLAARLSASARAALRFAVALGGEVPHQAHLPALVGDTHADAALGELVSCGLVSPVGSRYRLAAGVLTQLEAAGYGDDAEAQALAAARHYTWWAGHPSVTPERVCAEADAVLAALAVLVPTSTPPGDGEESTAVVLARTAAPAFAAGLHWSAWERALRSGAEASRLAGEVAEQAYFHHELGILALCGGLLDRARAELETSIGLRGALADKRGTVAGRRALALVGDRSGTVPDFGATTGEEVPDARTEESASPPGGVPSPFPALQPPGGDGSTLLTYKFPAMDAPSYGSSTDAASTDRVGLKGFARRNLVAAGAGALLVAVLGTVVTLGATSHNDANDPSNKVSVNPSAGQGVPNDGNLSAEVPKNGTGGDTGTATSRPSSPGPDGTYGTPRPRGGLPQPSPDGTKQSGHGSPSPSSTSPKPSGSSSSPGGGTTGGSTSGSTTGGTSGTGGTTSGTSSGSTGGSTGGGTAGSTGGTTTGGSTGGSTSGSTDGGTAGSSSGSTSGSGGSTSGGDSGTSTGTTGTTSGTGSSSPSSSLSASPPTPSTSQDTAPTA
ncbi:ATP-binding protein [Streptomyces sp. Li-HN-5-11]|uniref:ATP-binding protein n=1 Tax=Streptomyces sp. Li-HN-5-11 TaxID=3075432 RepID=UPI0028B1ADA4|nr:ATP-binding protein [Streptomyces sp. Li-HN-5-11]WNM30301.1 ATP-binding protein [Streptomyces sp. Li-HN-5-11]